MITLGFTQVPQSLVLLTWPTGATEVTSLTINQQTLVPGSANNMGANKCWFCGCVAEVAQLVAMGFTTN